MISRKDFCGGNFKGRNTNLSIHPILIFLKNHRNNAYKVKEISKYIKMKEFTIRSFLNTAMANKWVVHKTPYYIINLKK